MTYITFSFFIFLILLSGVYFCTPQKYRYIVLMLFSGGFIYFAGGLYTICFIYGTTVFSYVIATGIQKIDNKIWKKAVYIGGIALILGVLFFVKYKSQIPFLPERFLSIAVPIGISFYTLQIYAYLSDVYCGRIEAEKHFFKYVLYITWFPHILQGPIARYDRLSKSLFAGAAFHYDRVCKGLQLMIWGLAQKLIIADRGMIVVTEVFDNYGRYGGVQVIYAAVLYGIALYADFSGCVNISIGVSQIFGITLAKNFEQPYFATSVKDFWRRWHMSLSAWLKDYVYIPLGGNRKGKIRKYLNLMMTFLISGLWHGVGNRFLVWGCLHGIYQIVGELTKKGREKLVSLCHIKKDNRILYVFRILMTFIFVDIAWVFFRADSISHALRLLKIAATEWNLWALVNEDLYAVGIDRRETWIMLIFIVIMFVVDYLHEKHIQIRERIAGFSILGRWCIYLGILMAVVLFGKYGYGFESSDFIYMNF